MREASGLNVTLPYYDWADDTSFRSGDIPALFKQAPFNGAWISPTTRNTFRSIGASDINMFDMRMSVNNVFARGTDTLVKRENFIFFFALDKNWL